MAPPPDAEEEVDVGDGDENVAFVSKKVLEELKKKVDAGEDITAEALEPLASPSKLPDEDIVIPVDLRGLDKTLGIDEDDIVDEEMQIDIRRIVAKLGPKAAAEAFLEAQRCFDARVSEQPADERPESMTVKEWKQLLEEGSDGELPGIGDLEGGESEEDSLDMDGSDLDFDEGGEEEEPGGAPNAKKQRTA